MSHAIMACCHRHSKNWQEVDTDKVEGLFRTAEATTHQLNLSGAHLNPDAGVLLGNLLEGSHLTHINLAKNQLGDEGCVGLVTGGHLTENFFLHRLVLSENTIGDAGVSALVDALVPNRHLKEVDLYRNAITPKGAVCIARLLRYTHHLESLLLGSNQIGDVRSAVFLLL